MLGAIVVLTCTFGAVRFLELGTPGEHHGTLSLGHVAMADGSDVIRSAPLALPERTAAESQDVARVAIQPTLGAPVPIPDVDMHAAPSLTRSDPADITGTITTADPQLTSVEDVQRLLDAAPPAAGVPTATETSTDAPPIDTLPAAATPQAPEPVEAEHHWVEHEVQKGESLAKIFHDRGLEPALLHRIVNTNELGSKLARIRPGQTFRFQFDDQQELTRLELHRNRIESIRVAVTDDAIDIEEISKDVDVQIASAAGVIESSLFVDAQAAGMSDGQIMDLAQIFGWDIDFALEIRAGDHFRVLYEEHYLDGEKLRDGPILAAEFTSRGTTYSAVRYEDKNGDIGYYDVDGNSKRRAFIRTPIRFARISSRFNPKRWHPVLKRWRSHKGVDYAAPKGTPVKATGDGRVVFRGTKSGYGKTVIIEHAGKYTTLYAHLNGYSKRSAKGKRVKQGQVIGYVGKTGLATGPHLHYEFRVNGQHRDPLRVKLPKSLALTKSELPTFREQTAPLLTQLAAVPSATMVASAPATQREN